MRSCAWRTLRTSIARDLKAGEGLRHRHDFQCPSDESNNVAATTGVWAYVYTSSNTVYAASWGPTDYPTLGMTNYAANAGYIGGGYPELCGPYFTDSKTKINTIPMWRMWRDLSICPA